MKYGIKIIGHHSKHCISSPDSFKTERGWESWLCANDFFVDSWKNIGIMMFANLNDAFRKMEYRGGNNDTWHTVIEEIKE